MSISIWLDDLHRNDGDALPETELDIAVIGGGISGVSVAYWLREAGMRVGVIERGDLASGASGRNAGFITCGSVEHYSRQVSKHGPELARTLWQHSQENLALIRDQVVLEGGVDCDFRQVGTYSLAGTPHELEELRRSTSIMQAQGIAVTEVDEAHIERHLGARGFYGGVLYHDDGECHPVKLVRGIASLSGAQLFPQHEVFRVEQVGDGFCVHTQRRRIRASFVVLATNGYSHLLDKWFDDKIYPTRGQILVTEPVAPFMAAPCYCNHVLDYFRQLPDGRVLIGGFRQLAREQETGVADEPNEVIHGALEEFLRRHFVALDGVRISHRWAGIMGFSQDGLPMVGSLPSNPHIYFIGGFTGHGMGQAFRVAKTLAGVMLRGESAGPYSAKRFG